MPMSGVRTGGYDSALRFPLRLIILPISSRKRQHCTMQKAGDSELI
jgi:hypothetical protein